ncbi:MAG: alpha/beta hydrolase [Candidatus Kariarchaeaceae archaeon]|jgi:pimeloyl-ACP methyl ester carboxylesterase
MTTIHTFQGLANDGPVLFLAPGATQVHFKREHKLVKALLPVASLIISIDLPGHGGSQLDSSSYWNFEQALDNIERTLQISLPQLSSDTLRVGFIGFSLGGLFGMRINHPPFHFAVYIGCGTHFSPDSLTRIQWFFSEETYRRLDLLTVISVDHGPYWKEMIKMIQSWFSGNSPLITKPLKALSVPSLFILAENDQAFPRSSIKFDQQPVLIVPGDHFSYFTKKGFSAFEKQMIDFIRNYS